MLATKRKDKIRIQQKKALLADFNIKEFPKPTTQYAVKLFESQVKKTPEKIAIEFGKEKITYCELNRKADSIGLFLTKFFKNKNQQKIYTLTDNGIDIVAAFLGILKSGNILVPLNPKHPPETIKEIFNVVRPDLIIVQKKYFKRTKQFIKIFSGLHALIIDDKKRKDLNASCALSPKLQLTQTKKSFYSHIYFTSGSTGRPRAILGTNLSLAFNSEIASKKFFNDKSRLCQFLSISSHTFLKSGVMPALCLGTTLCVPKKKNLQLNISELISWIEDNKITLLALPTALFKYFTEGIRNRNQLKSLKHVLVMSDKLENGKYLKMFFSKLDRCVRLVNIYGSTEAPLNFVYELTRADLKKSVIPAGKSLGGKAIALNDKKEAQPPGETGEIYVRSPYLSAGYYNNPKMTAEVFTKNLFGTNNKDIIYRTRDMGKLLPDGNLEILGRSDSFVKIGGQGINLKEIETKILEHKKIKECVVLVKKNEKRENYIIAYFTANGKINSQKLRKFLKKKIPGYKIPGFFVMLDKFPLNTNSKIDKINLPEPKKNQLVGKNKYQPPITDTEKKLAVIWQEVLGIKNIGVNDNFFELGGQSLTAIGLLARINKELKLRLTLREIFFESTIKKLATTIEQVIMTDYVVKKIKKKN